MPTPAIVASEGSYYGKGRPIGVVFWAFVSDEVEELLKAGTTKLRPQDWKSGDKAWIVEVIAPFGGSDEIVQELKAVVLLDQPVRYMAFDGKRRAFTQI